MPPNQKQPSNTRLQDATRSQGSGEGTHEIEDRGALLPLIARSGLLEPHLADKWMRLCLLGASCRTMVLGNRISPGMARYVAACCQHGYGDAADKAAMTCSEAAPSSTSASSRHPGSKPNRVPPPPQRPTAAPPRPPAQDESRTERLAHFHIEPVCRPPTATSHSLSNRAYPC
jgi:hypothetical protein